MAAEIRTLSAPAELAAVDALFQQIWGTTEPVVQVELLRAVAYAGGYVAGAFDGERHLVGASFGFLADHSGERALHSHVTGVLPGVQHSGIGRTLKDHQRAWAAERAIPWITWTFDPLVRRNAWFNIAVLGVEVDAYLPSFYGTMTDAINAGDESDRLHVAWDVRAPLDDELRDGSTANVERLVPTPDNVVELRRSDPVAVARWRRDTRDALGGALASGHPIVGFTADGHYAIGTNR